MSDAWFRRRPIDGGTVTMTATSGTERRFEVERGGHVFRDTWDPRETSVTYYIELDHWTEPPDAPMSDEDRGVVLDAIWSMAPESGGLRRILRWMPSASCFSVGRWAYDADGFLVRIATTGVVEYLELDRTAHVPYEREPGSDERGRRRAVVGPRTEARWVYPNASPIGDDDWARILPRLLRATEANMFDTDPGWVVVDRRSALEGS